MTQKGDQADTGNFRHPQPHQAEPSLFCNTSAFLSHLGHPHQLEMATNRYVYTRLSGPRQIRLLKLHPASNSDEPELSVDLVHTSVDFAPHFNALSYAWGDPLPRHEILCSGSTAEIGPSLYGALRHLRDRNTGGQDNWLWADALCINQYDNAEREAQVRIMGDIYAAADFTVIWLGEDEHITGAFYWLERFSDAYDTLNISGPKDDKQEKTLAARLSADDHLEARAILRKAFGDKSSQIRAFQDIWSMLRHPWFTRKWVIQESVKSQSHGLVFLVGDVWMTWWKLSRWLIFLEWSYYSYDHFIASYSWRLEDGESQGINHWVIMWRARILTSSGLEEAPLLHLLAHTIMFKCTKPHDHIIALLGIASDSSVYEDLIDYNSSAEDLYRRITCACLGNSRDLRIVWSFYPTIPMDRRLSSSWIPNIHELTSDFMGSSFTHSPERLANASGSTQIEATISGNILRIRGRVIDSIEQLGTNMSDLAELAPDHARRSGEKHKWVLGRVNCWLEECLIIAGSAGVDELGLRDAILIENFLDDMLPGSGAIAKKGFFTFPQYLKAYIAAEDEAAYLEILHNTSWEVRNSTHAIGLYLDRMFYRRFGRTRDGKIGWMPLVAEEGDRICVFDGMEFPYAIRQKEGPGGKYMLVGECYISSLMNGEAMEMPDVESVIINLE